MSQLIIDWSSVTELPTPATVTKGSRGSIPPRRTARFEDEPGFYEDGGLWLYGNVWNLNSELAYVEGACGRDLFTIRELELIESQAESIVFANKTLVCGIHNPAHQRAAVVPLRWGCPRIVVMSGGFKHHLGEKLEIEPFRAARLWRYRWDPKADLAISRRAPDKLPTYALYNPTIDRLIGLIARREWPGLLFQRPSVTTR